MKHGDSITTIGNELAQVTESVPLYGGDMLAAAEITRKLAGKMSADISTFPDPRQREAIVTELLYSVIRTGSNLLECSHHQSWKDLTYKQQLQVATEMLMGLEENAFLLAETVRREKRVVQTVKNILLSVRVVPLGQVSEVEVFPLPETHVPWPVSQNWVELPRMSVLENSDGGYVRIVFATFDRLDEVLQPRNRSQRINSKIIAASLGKGKHIQLSKPVKIILQHIDTTGNLTNPTCVFWDYVNGAWSDEGCHVEETNTTHTMCVCDHLTNFAILMDVRSVKIEATHEFVLSFITYVGCIISVVCLALAFLTFQIFRGLKSDRTTIHKNLCICLLIAEVVFLFGIGQTQHRVICGAVAGLLHFFFLCAFAWMFLEGFQLYVMLIEVFEAEKSRIRWYYTFAYGAPLIIVAVSCSIDHLSYGTEKYCWLRADNFFIFSFVGPVIAVILANLVFLSMAIYMMCRHASASASMKSKEHSRLASANGKEENALQNKLQSHLSWLRGAIVLVFLLGLTWTFGLLYLNEESLAMAYIFTTLNSFQGMFIFIFHCIQNDKVRKEYRKLVRRYPWLQCRKKSSRSGAAKEHGGRGTASGSGSGSGSGYAANNPNSHSTDSSALSPHGTSNISFKSYSRDSGHGGSEQEDSGTSVNPSTLRLQPSMRDREARTAASVGGAPRSPSPWNHTYTEIRDADPVYEEVGRRAGVAAVHGEVESNSRRRGGAAGTSAGTLRGGSVSGPDHRPLISGGDRDTTAPRARNARTVAVLDGETVVCHLEPERYDSCDYDPRDYEANSYDYGIGGYDTRDYGIRGYDPHEYEQQHQQTQPQQQSHHHHHHHRRRHHHREHRENREHRYPYGSQAVTAYSEC